MLVNAKDSIIETFHRAQQLRILPYVLLFFFLFITQAAIGGAVIYFSYLNQEESAIDGLLSRVQRDIKFDNGTWDLSEYNANSLIPERFRLYVFSVDGFVVDRWRPVPGFMDLTDIKYLLTFQTPQTVNSVTGNDWRVYSEPITNDGNYILGVIAVAYHQAEQSMLERTDERLVAAAESIQANLLVENGTTINTRNIERRTIPFDISFQVVDQYNQILIYNSNINSMGRIPGFIDPSYVRREMETPEARQIKSLVGQNTYLIKSRSLSNGEQQMGVVIVASSIAILYRTLELYALVCGIVSLMFTLILGVVAQQYVARIIERVKKTLGAQEKKLLSLSQITALSFSKKESILKINGQSIPITYATNQYYMCQAIFGSPKKKWETDELVDKLGEELNKNSWRKVYDAMAAINAKVATITDVKLIIVSNKTYQLNPQFLEKLS